MRLVLAAAILIVLFGVGAFAESGKTPILYQIKNPENYSTAKKQSTDKITESTLPTYRGEIVPPPKNTPDYAQFENEKSNKTRMEYATIAIAAATLIVLVFQLFVFGWQALRLSETVKATEKAAKAAQDSADGLKMIERAYVFASVMLGGSKPCANGKFIEEDYLGNGYMILSVKLTNHGKTPAILNKFLCAWYVQETEPTKSSAKAMQEEKIPEGIVIGSGEGHYIIDGPARDYVPADKWELVKNGKSRFFLYGRLEYKDILGDNRNTGFCWQYCPGDDVNSFTIADSDLNYYDKNQDDV